MNDLKGNQCECNCHEEDYSKCSCACDEHEGGNEICNCSCDYGHTHENKMDPVSMAQTMLEEAFFKALLEVHVQKIKERIEKEWGEGVDKAVDAIMQSMGDQWSADLAKSEASKELYKKLETIFHEKKK